MRKRSNYKPRHIIQNPLAYVLGGFQHVRDNEHATTLRIKNHNALAEITQGRATRDQIDVLIAAMNMAEALHRVNPDLGEEHAGAVRQAQDAIYTMCQRGLERERFIFTGPELTAVNLGMDIHDAQLDACTIAELERALALVAQEIRQRRARQIA